MKVIPDEGYSRTCVLSYVSTFLLNKRQKKPKRQSRIDKKKEKKERMIDNSETQDAKTERRPDKKHNKEN